MDDMTHNLNVVSKALEAEGLAVHVKIIGQTIEDVAALRCQLEEAILCRDKYILTIIDERDQARSQLVKARSDIWAHGFNSCLHVAISALNHLSSHSRPNGGQDAYSAEHLLQIADEIKRTIAHNIAALTDDQGTTS